MEGKGNMLISVVLPVYNVEQWIEESVRSVCEQDFPHDEYEIILVNDGTPDHSIEIAEEVLKASDVRYMIISQENQGLSAARNAGITNATGDYVIFVDPDDMLAGECLSLLYRAAAETQTELCIAGFERTTEQNRKGSAIGENVSHRVMSQQELLQYFLIKRDICCPGMLIKTSVLINRGIQFNPQIRFIEDGEFLWRLFSTVAAATFVDAQTYKYLTRANSIMTSPTLHRNVEANQHILRSLRELKKTNNGFDYDMAYARHIFACLHSFASVASYKLFLEYRASIYTGDVYRKLKCFPDYRIRILNFCLRFLPRIFFSIFSH